MKIISASRRSDIPAFHADWFMERVREGWFERVNPLNPRQRSRVSLAPAEVAAIVFWSKNPRPLMPHLDELERRGYCVCFQYTLNPYDGILEPGLPPLAERIDTFRRLGERLGPERVFWRYDPIILSSVTPVDWHLEWLDRLCGEVAGGTARLTISFLDVYARVGKRLGRLERERGIVCRDLAAPGETAERERLAAGLGGLGVAYGLKVVTCSEELDLTRFGIGQGSCIDGEVIRGLRGEEGSFPRDRNQRSACRCAVSVDMGRYDSCGYGCLYCYARRG
jgi:hypothetical protein